MKLRVIEKSGIVSHWIGSKEALKLVSKGIAELVDGRSIRMVGDVFLRRRSRHKCLRSGQAEVYEAVGIETHPKFVVGGLTRTETQPYPKPGILTWGHIGETKQSSKPR